MHSQITAGRSAHRRVRAPATLALLSTLLAACGGGGGGGGSSPPPQVVTHQVGGTVNGLVGSGLVVTDNAGDPLGLQADGAFSFATTVAAGGAYAVAIKSQPSSPAQTCVVSGGTGAVSNADVTSVRIDCSLDVRRLGGTVTGLAGNGLLLRESDGDTLGPSADGVFTFATAKPIGSSYRVIVDTQPVNPSQTCTVGGGTGQGTIAGADVTDVSVVCSTNAYSINGIVSGLLGTGLVLQDNGADDMPVSTAGGFGFATHVASGAAYKVTIRTQPTDPTQICTVGGGTGLVTSGDVANLTVQCSTESFSVRGSVGGLTGTGLVLQNNGADDLRVPSSGNFVFPIGVVSGAPYAVTVRSQPSNPAQTCTVSAGSTGTIGAADATGIAVVCSTNSYAVGGTVHGLWGTGLVLQDNGGDDVAVAANGAFRFATPVASGGGYAVTVRSVPGTPRQSCVATNASGAVLGSDVADVLVTCTPSIARLAFMSSYIDSISLGPIDGSVSPYAIDPASGALVTPGPAAGTGKGGGPVTLTPSGLYAYVPNLISQIGTSGGSVSSYRVDPSTGVMTAIGTELATDPGTIAIAMHPSGKFAYALNRDGSSVSAFVVAPLTGLLSPVQTAFTNYGPSSIAMDPAGRFLYVASPPNKTISVYAIDGNAGLLTRGLDASMDGNVCGVTVHPSGRWAYSYDCSTNVGTAAVRAFAVDPVSGALTPLNSAGSGVSPRALAVHPSGRFLYVANYGGPTPYTGYIAAGSISVYSIDPTTGALTQFLAEIPTGRGAGCFAVDPSGQYAYLDNLGTDTSFTPVLTRFAIDPTTGALTAATPDLPVAGCITLW